MLKKRKAPEVKAEPKDTFFICDENLNIEESDIYNWSITADPEYLKPVEGKRLTRIRYRALTDLELGQLPILDGRYKTFLSRILEACRYGLVSIDGVKLAKTKGDMGLYRLTTYQLNELCEYEGEIYFQDLIDKYVESITGDSEKEDEPEEEKKEEDQKTQKTNLPLWLGVHILLQSFRSRNINL